jgi:hypothetical protein
MDTASRVLTFDPDREELAHAFGRHLVEMTKTAWLCILISAFLIGIGVYSIVAIGTRLNDVAAGFAIAYGLLVGWANTPWGRRTGLRRMIASTPSLTAHRDVIAASDGLRVVTPTSEVRLAWSHYQSVVQDELGVTLVQRGGTAATFVPRRAFADAAEESEWAQRVEAWVAEASAPSNA